MENIVLSALSLQMPWLSLEEFYLLTSRPLFEWREIKNLSQATIEFLSTNELKALTKARAVVDQCASENIQILYPGGSNYPDKYFELEDPPLFLTLEGSWSELAAMAVVGSREPSRYAVDWLNENLPRVYEKSDFVIVSGGARGIDQTAHLCAVRKSKPTLVFLPSGLKNIYPPDLRKWKSEILDCGGGFVSELPLEMEMRKHHFVKRNRLIVAAADLVFVAEARRRSGSMITAKIAQGMDREICALPTSPAMTCGEGSLDLIYEGAAPLRDHEDLQMLLESSSKRVSGSLLRQWRIQYSQTTSPEKA